MNKITEKYLKKESNEELPQLNRIIKDKDPAKLLKRAAKAINFDLTKLGQSDRIFQKDVQDRDVFLYWVLKNLVLRARSEINGSARINQPE